MTDLRLVWNPATNSADIALDGADLAADDGLETAVIISLFSRRRARPDDRLPAEQGGPRGGWWADAFPQRDGDLIGSRRWLLARAKQLQVTLSDSERYDLEALAWLVEDGVASAIAVTASRLPPDTLATAIAITRPDGSVFRFNYVWEAP